MNVCLLTLTAPFFLLPLGAAPEFELRPEPSAWRFAHPNAQILAGADLFRLGQNPLGEKLRQQFLAAMGPELSRHVQRLLVSTAFAADGSADTVLILSGRSTPRESNKWQERATHKSRTTKALT